MESLATYPHTATPPGTVVSLRGQAGTFTVMSSFVMYQEGKKRHCYLLRASDDTFCLALNTWHTPFSYLSERLNQLQAAHREEADLREALRRAAGEQ